MNSKKINRQASTLLAYSKSYQKALLILESKNEGLGKYYPASYFLALHAIELALKAVIISKSGSTKEDIKKKYGHNLSKLMEDASKLVSYSGEFQEVVKMMSPFHEDHSMRYFKKGAKSFPVIEQLLETVAESIDVASKDIFATPSFYSA